MNESLDLSGDLEYDIYVAGENVESVEIADEIAVTVSEEDLANVEAEEAFAET